MTNPMQAIVNAMGAGMRSMRSDYHLTLGKLIERLEHADADVCVRFDWNNASPGEEISYRGYYEDLAFETGKEPKTAAQFLDQCRNALGKEYTGYKGGDFCMDANTPLWNAEYGQGWDGRAIIGFAHTEDGIVLITKEPEDA